MEKSLKENTGIKRLLKKYKRMFHIPENLNYYSEADYKKAEKKFLKFAIREGKV